MFQAKEALLCPKEECSEPCHSSPTWGAINYFLFSLQNMIPICSTSAPHVSLKIGSVPQKTLFPIYTGHIVPQIASLPMDIHILSLERYACSIFFLSYGAMGLKQAYFSIFAVLLFSILCI